MSELYRLDLILPLLNGQYYLHTIKIRWSGIFTLVSYGSAAAQEGNLTFGVSLPLARKKRAKTVQLLSSIIFQVIHFLSPNVGDMDLPKHLLTYSSSPNSFKDEYQRDV